MRLLFATDRMHVPDDHSGSVQTTHALAIGLVQRGHHCEVMATLPAGTKHTIATIGYRLTAKQIVPEWTGTTVGYAVHRGSEWRFAERVNRQLRRQPPDVLVLDALRQLHSLKKSNVKIDCPIVLFVHEVGFLDGSQDLPFADQLTCVANSPYTAQALQSHFGISTTVIPPVVDFSQYCTARPAAKYTTMVSPTKMKGIDTTLHLAAALPEVPFLLVEGWPMSSEQWTDLSTRVAKLPNVVLRRSTSDMRTVYRDTRVLLVPTQERGETFGRVAVEAQSNGIPVMASDRGALGWVVGAGGIVIPSSAPDIAWEAPLLQLLTDAGQYAEVSRLALCNAERPEFQPARLLADFEHVVASRRRE